MTDAPVPKEKYEIGDLVEAHFHGLMGEGVIENISDGSERNRPGELMYYVRNESLPAPIWLHQGEIIRKLDPREALNEAARFSYTMRKLLWNTAMVKAAASRGTKIFKGWL